MSDEFLKQILIFKFKEVIVIGIFRGIPWGRAQPVPFILDFEEKGFGFFGGDDGVVTKEDGWVGCSVGVAATPEVTRDGEERGNLGRGELVPLGSVSVEVD